MAMFIVAISTMSCSCHVPCTTCFHHHNHQVLSSLSLPLCSNLPQAGRPPLGSSAHIQHVSKAWLDEAAAEPAWLADDQHGLGQDHHAGHGVLVQEPYTRWQLSDAFAGRDPQPR
eukprot:9585576-Lingulodinium_polyedra.AAC.2